MIHTLNPNESFPIMRGIGNHLDTDTYYVRAFIRDAVTDSILSTVDLSDKGGQRFQKAWRVVYDNVFQKGRYVTIVTSVYTDSNYTTKSNKYGDEFETYLVQERWNLATMASIGGGGGIDYKELRKVVKEEVGKVEKPDKEKELDSKKLIKEITKDVIKNIPPYPEQKDVVIPDFPKFPEIPKPEKVDLSKIEKGIILVKKEIMKEIQNRPKFEKMSTEHITEMIDKLDENIKSQIADILEAMDKKMNLNIDINKELSGTSKEDLVKILRAKYKL